jgi:dTDP-4-amino-4,6-dideoxygalactose transaminase
MKYSLACDTWDNKELEAIQSVIKSGRYTMGPRVKQFEKEIVFFRVYQVSQRHLNPS